MSHREKVAYLSLLGLGAAFGPYFLSIILYPASAGETPDLTLLIRFGAAAVAQMAILGIGHLVLRLRWPEDARAPADERDRAVERRSMRIAYYVLIAGMIVVGVVMPFSASGWAVVNSAVAAIVVAELVHYGVAVRSYRRGWDD